MNYIVFDLEWNQPVKGAKLVTEPVYLTGEIIEIGAVKLNEKFEAVDELRLYVKPQYYTWMNDRVTILTHINNQWLQKHGTSFPEACRAFQEWCGEEYAFMTWSDSDLPVLVDNMILHGMDVSRLPVCYDIQRIFGREIMRSDRQYSLDDAVEVLGEHGDRAHDALHDAKNTVLICNHLELDDYLSEYGSRAFAEKPGDRQYDSCSEAIHDPALARFTCPWCGEEVATEGWIPLNGRRYMAMGSCSREDEFILYLECPRCGDGVRTSRMLYEMSDDLWDRYMDRVEAGERFEPVL